MDINQAAAPDLIASITDMSVLSDGAVDAIWSSHMLEHLYRHEVATALRECWRVLAPGGVFVAIVPDFQQVCSLAAADQLDEVLYTAPAGPVTAHDIIFGFGKAVAEGNTFMAHRTGFTPTVLGRDMQDAGFDPVLLKRQPVLELLVMARRPYADGHPIANPFRLPF